MRHLQACPEQLTGNYDNDLLIIGPGVLGGLLGKLWKEENPSCNVVGVTNTTNNHAHIQKLGVVPKLKGELNTLRYPYVVFSAPPSGSTDYSQEVENALNKWDNASGCFLFTSSSAVFNAASGKPISENTPLHPTGFSEKIDRLLECEKLVLDAGGCVVRLVGLYHANRGPHTFFLRQGNVSRWGGHVVNLIHYEDAATFCIKVLMGHGTCGNAHKSKVFLAADAHPLTFQEMMNATIASGKYEGNVCFLGEPEKRESPPANNTYSRSILDWKPKYKSYLEFMANGAVDFYTEFSSST